MMDKLKNFLKKNQYIYKYLNYFKTLLSLFSVYLLQLFNIFRKDNCSKNSIRCEYDMKNKHYKYTLLGKDTPICCLTHLYEITRDVTKVLNREGIEYFIMYGTLLGQVRHKQTFIPWDTDVDIVIMQKDKEAIVNLFFDEFSDIYDLYYDEKILKINFSKKNKLHVDIYFWEEKEKILIDSMNDYWIKNRIKKEDVFPLVKSKIFDIDVKIPKNAVKVLKDTYGVDCLDMAYKKYAFTQDIATTFDISHIDNIYITRK